MRSLVKEEFRDICMFLVFSSFWKVELCNLTELSTIVKPDALLDFYTISGIPFGPAFFLFFFLGNLTGICGFTMVFQIIHCNTSIFHMDMLYFGND